MKSPVTENNDPERLARQITLDARGLEPGGELEAFLSRRCGDDEDLRDRVRTMTRDSFLEAPALGSLLESHATAPEVGGVYGDLKLVEEIGRGGNGIVFRATQAKLSRDVAAKWLYRGRSRRAEERVLAEARTTARLSHECIASVYSVDEQEDGSWIVMEYIKGHDLYDEIRWLRKPSDRPHDRPAVLPKPWSRGYLSAVLHLIKHAAEALQHAHDSEVVHRDVKPHNLLLRSDGRPVLVDFGLARDARFGSEDDGALRGTPGYMSPEQAQEALAPSIDARTDVYSLGVVLYELLTQRRPF
ncbi:MAG: serine/threonine-protein kinase, partial [Planctomycetota bacterium]